MSIEKCFAVYFPLKAKTICTVRTAKWVTGIVGVNLVGYDSLYFFVVDSHKLSGRQICLTVGNDWVTVVDSVLYSFAPFTLMFITNVAIVFMFMRAKCKGTNSSESTNQALCKSATRGTTMVVTVSVTFLLLTAPSAVHSASYMWHSLAQRFALYRAFMNLTQYSNHSINGILYCIVGSKFRQEFLKIICRKEKTISSINRTNNTDMILSKRGR